MITFKLREEEYLEGSSAVSLWPRERLLVIALEIGALIIIGCYFAFPATASPDQVATGWTFFCLALIAAILIAFGRPIAFRRKFRKNFRKLIEPLSPATVSWDTAGLAVEVDGKRIFNAWREFTKWKQTEQLVMLYKLANKGSEVIMLPKRAFSEPGKLEELTHLIASSIGNSMR